jgi:hypothetical protein
MTTRPGALTGTLSRAQDKAVDGLRTGGAAVADAIDSAATRVTAGGEQLSDAARTTADRLTSSAEWVRETSSRDLVADIQKIVKVHPGRALLGAALVGFLAARLLRRG